jgi:hypothetical protein
MTVHATSGICDEDVTPLIASGLQVTSDPFHLFGRFDVVGDADDDDDDDDDGDDQ